MDSISACKPNVALALALGVLLIHAVSPAPPASALPGPMSPKDAGKVKSFDANELADKACVFNTMPCGATVFGVLDTTDCELGDGTYLDFWQFQGTAGQTVTIDLTSTAFDTFLFLLDPAPSVVAVDDDAGAGLNSRIVYTLEVSGTWMIAANGFSPGDVGDYTLRLQCGGGVPVPPAAPSNLTATAVSSSEIELAWQDNSDNEDEFRVEVKQESALLRSELDSEVKRSLIAKGARPLSSVELLSLPAVDHQALLSEDAANTGPGAPLRFAQRQEVFHTPWTSGTWEILDDGSQLWRLRVRSPGALSLSFAFARYSMPAGGSLIVYSPAAGRGEASVLGPYGERDNKPHGQLWTPILPGDEAVIEVRVPAGRAGELELTAVNHGYRELFRHPTDRLEKSGACNVDVVCPEANGWQDQIRSVARITISGTHLCSGAMVDNTAGDLKPLFLTAHHCGLDAASAPSLVTYWHYQSSTCRPPGSTASGGLGDGSLSQSLTGSTYLAGSDFSDFTLVELDESPPLSYGVFWAGWDRRPIDFSSATTIHHPEGDEKRISFENDPTSTTSWGWSSSPGDGSHIRIEDWDLGTTEPGSSGSPLFSDAKRVIGQLHGGLAACGNDLPDWYGRLSTSWSLGLSSWLDPGNTGLQLVDGRDQDGTFRDIGSVPANSVGAAVLNLEPSTRYTFRVRARNSAGDSGYSNEASATTLTDDEIFSDGFESGDATLWSQSVP